MKYFEPDSAKTQLGLAYGPSALTYLENHPEGLDYIEVPFEQLRHTPEVASMQKLIPMILHCASVSVAGTVSPTPATLQAIAQAAEHMRTPWIGEHLAFVSAEPLDRGDKDAAPTSLTYTMCPQLSEAAVDQVVRNLAVARTYLGSTPLLLENSPQYFAIPGSTMPMSEFIAAVMAQCDANLLLDLSHFLITCINTGVNPRDEIHKIPLHRVVEIHMSGVSQQSGIAWDDHAAPAPPIVFELLEQVLAKVRPQALTVEYNWSATFPQPILHQHLQRVRTLLEAA
ncbi:DUF692 domain-containing protein [Dyella tabacisoli]|uniref:DUF692 family protein n=1 Tax=Dyella tabacisoli TaxID=2282381 RepID=A0A369UN29_9GAMM|nr:DUF692 family multinuclear iron-containing protein [Dyella tabacisoli]RDD82172.1 DUF692 family protein [Dyella tabacisoli]